MFPFRVTIHRSLSTFRTRFFARARQPFSYDKKVVSRKSQTLTRTIFKLQLRIFQNFSTFLSIYHLFFYLKFLDISLFRPHFPFVYRFYPTMDTKNPNTNTLCVTSDDRYILLERVSNRDRISFDRR